MIEVLHYLIRTLRYGNYGIFLNMGNAGFTSSTVGFCISGYLFRVNGSTEPEIKPGHLG